MADNDRTRGYRDNETYRRPRPQQPADGAGDPLAELARLIGQQNESAPSYRQNGARSPYGTRQETEAGWAAPGSQTVDRYQQDPRAAQWSSSYADDQTTGGYGSQYYPNSPDLDGGSHSSDRGYGTGQYASSYGDRESYDAQYSDPRYGDPRYAAEPGYGDPRYAEAAGNDSRYSDPRFADPRYADPHYQDPQYDAGAQGYADPRYSDPRYAEPMQGAQSYGAGGYDPSQGYAPSGADQGYAGYGYGDQAYANGYYGAGAPVPAVAQAANAQTPARRRGSIVTVLAVLALAVVGTAAAFGYRAMFGGGGTAVPPPVIKADTRPSKVIPTTDPNAKPIQDRIGAKIERVVPREEEPVQQAAPGQPRVISPWLAGQNPQAMPAARASIPQSAGDAAPQQGAQPAAAEPKRIRTVPIKPQQGAEAPQRGGTRSAAVPAQSDPEADTPHPQQSGAPLALSPTTGSLPPPQRHAVRPQTAALAPDNASTGSGSPFPTPIPSSAPVSSGNAVSGPYAVQVTSQRSESDAQASFRSLQQQFPSVLGNRRPVIRRADLGDRGTYYRAQIPFSSQNEASEFCSSLKAAGGQCVVQRN